MLLARTRVRSSSSLEGSLVGCFRYFLVPIHYPSYLSELKKRAWHNFCPKSPPTVHAKAQAVLRCALTDVRVETTGQVVWPVVPDVFSTDMMHPHLLHPCPAVVPECSNGSSSPILAVNLVASFEFMGLSSVAGHLEGWKRATFEPPLPASRTVATLPVSNPLSLDVCAIACPAG